MVKIKLDFTNNANIDYDNYRNIFQKITARALQVLNYKKGTFLVEVLLVNDEEMQTINKTMRDVNEVTDVLAFAYTDKASLTLSNIKRRHVLNLGSVVVSVPTAIIQAKAYGHPVERELKFLYTHGLLHLLGFDHDTPETEQHMIQLQNKIIGQREVTI